MGCWKTSSPVSSRLSWEGRFPCPALPMPMRTCRREKTRGKSSSSAEEAVCPQGCSENRSRIIATARILPYTWCVDPYAIDLDEVRSFLRRREENRARALAALFQQAREDFARITRHIEQKYNPRRIYQWGSLLERAHFSEISDIDIAVEELGGPKEYFAVLGDAASMTDLPVDLIELERVPGEIALHIKSKGKLVYERPVRR
jgi:predicted nucleotidyltransferase